eukprot:g1414.t1
MGVRILFPNIFFVPLLILLYCIFSFDVGTFLESYAIVATIAVAIGMTIGKLRTWSATILPKSPRSIRSLEKDNRSIRSIAIIGAGPSGLVAGKILSEAGISFRIFEKERRVGGAFRYRSYQNAEQVSSKFITAFSDFRFADDVDDHVSLDDYCVYLETYCDRFELWPRILFETTVLEVKKNPDNSTFRVEFDTGDRKHVRVETFDAVLVCSGLHQHAYMPSIKDMASFDGRFVHSSQYRSVERPFQMQNKRVVVVGCGETGLDIARHALEADASSVTLSHRTGWLSVPKQLPNKVPLDIYITNLFEASREHRWIDRYRVKWFVATFFIRLFFFLGTGTSKGFDQWAGTKSVVRRGYWFVNKQCGPMPQINKPYVRGAASWVPRLWRRLGLVAPAAKARTNSRNQRGNVTDVTKRTARANDVGKGIYCRSDRTIQLVPQIVRVKLESGSKGSTTFECVDKSTVRADVVVFATGYRQRFPFLPDHPTCSVTGDHAMPPVRGICFAKEPRLAFIGFLRPNVGAIPPMSELQVYWWLRGIVDGRISLDDGRLQERSYALLGDCHKTRTYGADYGLYMERLAADIGASPNMLQLFCRSPKAAVAYALGQCFVPFYRIMGPCAPCRAREQDELMLTCDVELWGAFKRRGWKGNLMFLYITVQFAFVNLACLLVDIALQAIGFHVD